MNIKLGQIVAYENSNEELKLGLVRRISKIEDTDMFNEAYGDTLYLVEMFGKTQFETIAQNQITKVIDMRVEK